MKLTIFAIFTVAIFLSCGLLSSAAENHGIETVNMDRSADPCKDFFEYSNGSWLKKTEIPADRSAWGSFQELADRNQDVLHQILEDAAKKTDAPKGSTEWKVGEFYRVGMDTAKIEAQGAEPLKDEFARIDAVKDSASVQEEISRLHRRGVFPGFAFFVAADFKNSTMNIAQLYQAGLGMPDRDYYLSDDPKMKETRTAYVAHVSKMFQLLGDDAAKADQESKVVMDMETRLAKVSMTPTEQRDPNAIYHKMTVTDLNGVTSDFTWSKYFEGIGLKDPGAINVAQPNFIKEFGSMVASVPLDQWKTYMRWQLIHSTAGRLSSAFENEDFHFNGTVIAGTKELLPRWKRVTQTTDAEIGEALGQLYVAKTFPPEAKARALELIQNVKAALRERLMALDWMGEDTRKQALNKLDKIAVKIGYPDKWRDYSTLALDSGTYVGDVMQADEFEFQRNINKVGKPVDRGEWGMTPPTVNAYYSPNFNDINFPAGILQPPFFDAKADDASNYGGIGVVIGHELTHGFDDQGRQFDAVGNLSQWWTPEDEKNFKARADLVDQQYSKYEPLEGMHINGRLTLGENIADIGGVKIAYVALQKALAKKPQPKIDGLTPDQRFFISFGQIWRGKERPERTRLRLTTNPHSPNKYRVVGALADNPEFYKAFSCAQPEKPAAERISIW
jgi:Predicted metalloendopeptidase